MKNKSVAIIGATCKLGIEISKTYANKGFDLVLISRNYEKNYNLKKLINTSYPNVEVDQYELDILDIENQKKIYKTLKKIPDGVISLVGETHKFEKIEDNSLFRIFNINFLSLVKFLNYFLNDFEKRNYGFLICLSSVAGIRGRAKNFFYGSAKAALSTFLSGCRNYYNNKNIFIMTVFPGFINNDYNQMSGIKHLLHINPTNLADKIYRSHVKKKEVLFSSLLWVIIMTIIRILPNSVFKKIKF